MNPLLEAMLGTFDLSEEVVLTIDNNGKNSYLKGRIKDIQEESLLILTKNSIVRISPERIIRIGKAQSGESKAKNSKPYSKIEEPKDSTTTPKKVKKEEPEKVDKKTSAKPAKEAVVAPKTKETKSPVSENSKETKTKEKDTRGEIKQPVEPANHTVPSSNRPKDWDPKMLIPKMGDIIALEGDSIVIRTNSAENRTVSKALIIDKKLNKRITDYVINKEKEVQIPVIWGELEGEILCLLGESTLEGINSRVNTSRDVGNIKVAYALALLLNANSTSPTYARQLESFEKAAGVTSSNEMTSSENNNEQTASINYTKRGQEAKEGGQLELAITLFKQAIENDESGKATAFKELVSTLITLERFEDAYALLSEPGIMTFSSPLIGSSHKNFNWLSASLSRIGHDDDVIRINQTHSEETGLTAKQKAGCYNRIAVAILRSDIDGPEEKAEEYYKKALEIDPTNKAAREGLSALRPESFDLESVDEILDLEPSTYAEDKIQNITEEKRSKQFKDSLIEQLRILRTNSYSERASIHLQLASVERALGHESDMHRDLSKYLINCVLEGRRSKNLSTDAASFLLCESIAHWSVSARSHGRERSTTHYQDCLALFINLYNRQNPYYFFNSPKLYSAFENSLYDFPEFYPGLPVFLQYRVPFIILMRNLWESSAQSSAIKYLNDKGFQFTIEDGKTKFDQGFKGISNRERANTLDLINRFRQMAKSAGYEEMKGRLDEIVQPLLKTELDRIRFVRLKNFVDNTLTRYFHNEDITNKYYSKEDSLTTIDSLLSEIASEPTRFSYDGLRPVLVAIRNMVQSDYERLSENSKPKIDINQSGDCTLEDDVLSFQLNISNVRGRLAINNYHIEISETEDVVEHLEGMKIVYDSLSGGSDKNIIQKIRIAPSASASETVTINVTLYHGTVGKSEELTPFKKRLSLHLRNDDIPENPYSRYSGGKPIELRGREMFFGRKEEIKSVADAMMSEEGGKQIIIYGQSRSGKTSFRNILAIELEARGALCAKFSIQDAYPQSLASFFAVIMDRTVNILYEDFGWQEEDFKYAVSNHTTLISNTYKNTPEESISSLYANDLCALQKAVIKKMGKKLILMIDEFTELYTWIKEGLLPDSVMKIWKAVSENERLDYSMVLIGQDTTPLFMREPYASNPFQVIEPRRMSYLPAQDAREMIEKPILDREENSRFVGRAIERIIEYTAGSPYYLMIFCSKLVDYMRNKKIGKVTDVDVDEVARICISNPEVLRDKFDNLYAAVEPPIEEKERSKSILKAIAVEMERHKDGAARSEILNQLRTRYEEAEINDVLTDLEAREVISVKQSIRDKNQDKISINVIIFQKWLLEN